MPWALGVSDVVGSDSTQLQAVMSDENQMSIFCSDFFSERIVPQQGQFKMHRISIEDAIYGTSST